MFSAESLPKKRTRPAPCTASPIVSQPASAPSAAARCGLGSRNAPRCNCIAQSLAWLRRATWSTRNRENFSASSGVAAVPAMARCQIVAASASVQSVSGRRRRPWSVARPPAAAKSACRLSIAAISPANVSAPQPATSESRRDQAWTRWGSCTLAAASGRKVGTTFVAKASRAMCSCHWRLSAGSSVVPTTSTFIRRRMPRAVRSPVASCRLASSQIRWAVVSSSRSSI